MNDVANGGIGDVAVRVVRDDHPAGGGQLPADRPVVAAWRVLLRAPVLVVERAAPSSVLLEERWTRHAGPQIGQGALGLCGDGSRIEPSRDNELAPGTRVCAAVRFGYAVRSHASRQVEFSPRIGNWHRGLRPEQRRLRRPPSRLEPSEPELHGEVVARLVDECVHSLRERLEDALSIGMIAGPLPIIPWSTILEQACEAIVRDVRGAEYFRELPAPGAAIHIHLPQPVLRLHEPLGEEQILDVSRVDVRHAPVVPDDSHRITQSGYSLPPLDAGQGIACQGFERFLPRHGTGDHDGRDQDRDVAQGSSHADNIASRHGQRTITASQSARIDAIGSSCCRAVPPGSAVPAASWAPLPTLIDR